jgi:hypothetical protein
MIKRLLLSLYCRGPAPHNFSFFVDTEQIPTKIKKENNYNFCATNYPYFLCILIFKPTLSIRHITGYVAPDPLLNPPPPNAWLPLASSVPASPACPLLLPTWLPAPPGLGDNCCSPGARESPKTLLPISHMVL